MHCRLFLLLKGWVTSVCTAVGDNGCFMPSPIIGSEVVHFYDLVFVTKAPREGI